MSKIVNRLLKEHPPLQAMVAGFREADIGDPATRKQFKKGMKRLMAHLREEDKVIVPAVLKGARRSRIDAEMVKSLSHSLAVTPFLDYMYDKYRRKDVLVGFDSDMDQLTRLLNKRVQIEEKLLFPEYEGIRKR